MTQKKSAPRTKKETASRKFEDTIDSISLESFFPKPHTLPPPKFPDVQSAPRDPVLTEQQKALMPEAEKVLSDTFDRVRVLVVAAEKHVRRHVNPSNVDETDGLYMDDNDYNEFIANAAQLGELAILASMAKFVGLPIDKVDDAIGEKFNSLLNPPPPRKKS